MVALAAAVGWGRGWAGDRAGFQDRYVTMATPLWCWLAFAFRLYAPPPLGRLVPNVLFAASCMLAWPNAAGRARARPSRVPAGRRRSPGTSAPACRPIGSSGGTRPFLHPSQDEAARLLPILRRAGIGPFGSLRTTRPSARRDCPSSRPPSPWHDGRGRTAHVTGVDPQITFSLPGPRTVAGIRIKYSHANRQGAPARFQLTWKRPDQPGYTDDRRYANWNLPTGERQETTIWIDDTLDQFRIQPDNQPCEFRIDEIVLLEP